MKSTWTRPPRTRLCFSLTHHRDIFMRLNLINWDYHLWRKKPLSGKRFLKEGCTKTWETGRAVMQDNNRTQETIASISLNSLELHVFNSISSSVSNQHFNTFFVSCLVDLMKTTTSAQESAGMRKPKKRFHNILTPVSFEIWIHRKIIERAEKAKKHRAASWARAASETRKAARNCSTLRILL